MANLLSSASARKLAQLLDKPHSPARAGRGVDPGQLPVVLCGTLISSSPQPHYNGTVQWLADVNGPADAGVSTVVLTALNGETLTPGRYYHAIPSGMLDGALIYWTTESASGSEIGSDEASDGALFALTVDSTWTDTGISVTAPSAGWYFCYAFASVGAQANTAGSGIYVALAINGANTQIGWVRASTSSPANLETLSFSEIFYLSAGMAVNINMYRTTDTWTNSTIYGKPPPFGGTASPPDSFVRITKLAG